MPSSLEEKIEKYLAFWNNSPVERPMVGFSLGGWFSFQSYGAIQKYRGAERLTLDMLSPERHFDDHDRIVAPSAFPYDVLHLHSSSLHLLDRFVDVEPQKCIEINKDRGDGECPACSLFSKWSSRGGRGSSSGESWIWRIWNRSGKGFLPAGFTFRS